MSYKKLRNELTKKRIELVNMKMDTELLKQKKLNEFDFNKEGK